MICDDISHCNNGTFVIVFCTIEINYSVLKTSLRVDSVTNILNRVRRLLPPHVVQSEIAHRIADH